MEHLVRKAEIRDIKSIVRMSHHQWEREGLSAIGHTYNFSTSEAAAFLCIKDNMFEVFVAEVDGEVVGYILSKYHPLPYDQSKFLLQEVGLCVKIGFERRGIGWSLIKESEKAAMENGVFLASLGAPANEWGEDRQKSYAKRGYHMAEIVCYKMLGED